MTILEAVKKAGEEGFIRRSGWGWYYPSQITLRYEDILASDWEAKPKKRRWKLHVSRHFYGEMFHPVLVDCNHSDGAYETVSVVEE